MTAPSERPGGAEEGSASAAAQPNGASESNSAAEPHDSLPEELPTPVVEVGAADGNPNCDPHTGSQISVTFSLPGDVGAQFASVVGDFNGWDPELGVMDRHDDGGFSALLDVEIGHSYQYRYLLDGERWVNDWNAGSYTPNAFGGSDSVLDLRDAPAG